MPPKGEILQSLRSLRMDRDIKTFVRVSIDNLFSLKTANGIISPKESSDEEGGGQAQGNGAPQDPAFLPQGAAHGRGDGDFEG